MFFLKGYLFKIILLCGYFIPLINCHILFYEDVHSDNCTELVHEFAELSSNFIKCSILNAQPIKVCEKCVDSYKKVTNQHGKILNLSDEKGKPCRDRFIDRDRIEIIESSYQYITNLWDRCHCSSCYNDNFEKSNHTIQYEILSNQTSHCFNGLLQQASKVCVECKKKYCTLNEFYNSLGEHICMDLIDDMNSTRSRWSNEFKCRRITRKAEVPMIIAVSLLSLLPIVFYVTVRRFTLAKNSRLLKEKRLAVSFPSTSGFST